MSAEKTRSTYCLVLAHHQCVRAASCSCECHSSKKRGPMPVRAVQPDVHVTADGDDRFAWEDPPPVGRPTVKAKYANALERCKREPGRWARIGIYSSTSAANTAAFSLRKHCQGDGFEFKAGAGRLYARALPKAGS